MFVYYEEGNNGYLGDSDTGALLIYWSREAKLQKLYKSKTVELGLWEYIWSTYSIILSNILKPINNILLLRKLSKVPRILNIISIFKSFGIYYTPEDESDVYFLIQGSHMPEYIDLIIF